MKDITLKLREQAGKLGMCGLAELLVEAATQIDELRSENAKVMCDAEKLVTEGYEAAYDILHTRGRRAAKKQAAVEEKSKLAAGPGGG